MLDYCGLAKTVSKTLQNMIEVYPIDAYLCFIVKTFWNAIEYTWAV